MHQRTYARIKTWVWSRTSVNLFKLSLWCSATAKVTKHMQQRIDHVAFGTWTIASRCITALQTVSCARCNQSAVRRHATEWFYYTSLTRARSYTSYVPVRHRIRFKVTCFVIRSLSGQSAGIRYQRLSPLQRADQDLVHVIVIRVAVQWWNGIVLKGHSREKNTRVFLVQFQ